jgi:hypothetical protein
MALPPAAAAVAAYLYYDAWRRMANDPDSAIAEFVIAGVALLFAAKAAVDIYRPTTPKFVPSTSFTGGERRRLRILMFAVGASVALLAASTIAQQPHNPSAMLGGGSFVLIGILVMTAALRARAPIDNETKIRIAFWAMAGLLVSMGAVYWNEPLPLILIGGAGIVFAVLAVRASIRFGRFGKTDLVWDHEPLRLGDTIRGHLRLSRAATAASGGPFIIELRLYSLQGGSQRSLSDSLKVIWSRQLEFPPEKAALAPNDQRDVPIEFTLPETELPSGSWDGTQYSWQLEARRNMKGVDYAASFPLQVVEQAAGVP